MACFLEHLVSYHETTLQNVTIEHDNALFFRANGDDAFPTHLMPRRARSSPSRISSRKISRWESMPLPQNFKRTKGSVKYLPENPSRMPSPMPQSPPQEVQAVVQSRSHPPMSLLLERNAKVPLRRNTSDEQHGQQYEEQHDQQEEKQETKKPLRMPTRQRSNPDLVLEEEDNTSSDSTVSTVSSSSSSSRSCSSNSSFSTTTTSSDGTDSLKAPLQTQRKKIHNSQHARHCRRLRDASTL